MRSCQQRFDEMAGDPGIEQVLENDLSDCKGLLVSPDAQ